MAAIHSIPSMRATPAYGSMVEVGTGVVVGAARVWLVVGSLVDVGAEPGVGASGPHAGSAATSAIEKAVMKCPGLGKADPPRSAVVSAGVALSAALALLPPVPTVAGANHARAAVIDTAPLPTESRLAVAGQQ